MAYGTGAGAGVPRATSVRPGGAATVTWSAWYEGVTVYDRATDGDDA